MNNKPKNFEPINPNDFKDHKKQRESSYPENNSQDFTREYVILNTESDKYLEPSLILKYPKPTNNKPTNSRPTNNKPTNSKPTNSKPTNSKPTNSIPTNSKPTNSKPTNSIPTNSKPTNSIPTNSKPTNSKPTNSRPTKSRPTKSFTRVKNNTSNKKPIKEVNEENKLKTFRRVIITGFVGSSLLIGGLFAGEVYPHAFDSINKNSIKQYNSQHTESLLQNITSSEQQTYLSALLNKYPDKINEYKNIFNTHYDLTNSETKLSNRQQQNLDKSNLLITENRSEILRFCKDLILANILDTKGLSGNFEDYKLTYTPAEKGKPTSYSLIYINPTNNTSNNISNFSKSLSGTVLNFVLNDNDATLGNNATFLSELMNTSEELSDKNIKIFDTPYSKIAERTADIFEFAISELTPELTPEKEKPTSENSQESVSKVDDDFDR